MKGKTKRVLQVLSVAVGSALVCVPASTLLFGDNIVSALLGGLLAVYLTVRLVAAMVERDVNGKLNIFAAVFITLLTLLALFAFNRYTAPGETATTPQVEGVEEPTGSVAVTGSEPSKTPYGESPAEESSPLVPSQPSSQVSSLPLGEEGEEPSPLQKPAVPSAPVFAAEAALELVDIGEEAETEREETVRVPSAPVFVSEPIIEEEKAETEVTAVTPVPAVPSVTVVQTLVETEEEKPVRVPSAPVFVSGSTTLVPPAPEFTAEPEGTLVPGTPSLMEPSSALVPDAPELKEPVRALVPAAPVFKPVSAVLIDTIEEPKEEVDPWADFYFSDEELDLEDGIYYFSLYVNDYLEGDVEVMVTGGEVLVRSYDLDMYITGYLEEGSAERIFASTEDYYTTAYLASVGVDAWADTSLFEYYIVLSSLDMPLTRISIRGNSSRYVTRPISGAVTINPVTSYVISSYSLTSSTSITKGKGFLDNLRFTLSSSNSVRIGEVFGSFGWSLSGSRSSVAFSWGSYSFYKDYENENLRLRFGNVSSDSYSPTGTPIGIRIDKSTAYGSSTTKKRNDQKEILVEKDSNVVVYNEEREIYRRTLKAGRYLLEDFILYSGSNEIRVVITPLDGSDPVEERFTINYSASLLTPGEMYWGAAFAFSRQKVETGSERLDYQVDIPFINGKSLRYDITDYSASAYMNIGILETLTGNVQVALKGKRGVYSYRVSAEFTNLNALGTLKANVNYNYTSSSSLYLRLSEQFTLSTKGFVRGLTLSASYNKANLGAENGYTVTPSISLSGAFGIFSWSVGASGTLLPYSWETSTWMVTPSLSFSLRKINFSLSSTFSGVGKSSFTYSGRISASMRIGKVSTTASTSGKDSSVSASWSNNNYALSARMRTTDITDWRTYSYGADFSSSTKLFSYSASLSSSGSFETISLSGSMGFASVYAEGLFSFASSVPTSFLLIRQKGALRGNTVSVATAGSSESTVPSDYIGAILYRGLPTTGASNISIYSQNDTGFSSGQSFDIFIPDTKTRGYVVTLEGEAAYTLSGTVTVGDYVWRNGSSPLYKVYISEDGVITLESTEDYAFTDRNGIYILSDLTEGMYGFDVRADNKWYLYIVSVTDDLNPSLVTMVEEKTEPSVLTAPDVYYGVIETMNEREISADEFWIELYGEV